jgi:hypothetical protein
MFLALHKDALFKWNGESVEKLRTPNLVTRIVWFVLGLIAAVYGGVLGRL